MVRSFLARAHEFLSKLNKGALFALMFLLVALLGYLDYGTGFELTFSFFYLIPIVIVTWYISLRVGLVVALISVVAWLVSNWLAGEPYSHEAIRYFNAFMRLGLFVMVSSLLNELRLILIHERTLSRTDYLTGISNSREFFNRAELELERARRYKSPFSVAYIDLDNFKQVNDKLGHSEGDRLLKAITQTISASIRKTDTFARLGGDEFVILFSSTEQEGAIPAVQKIEKIIVDEVKVIAIPVTLSVGVATFKSAPYSVDKMLQKADELMYRAKSQGKNQVYYAQFD